MVNVFGINVLEFQSRSNGDQMMAGIIEHLSIFVWIYIKVFIPILIIDSSLFFLKEASSK